MAGLDSRLQDFARTLAGIALVARHTFLTTTHAVADLRSNDLPGFASSALSRVVTAATDVAGLSRGRSHTVPPPHPASNGGFSHDDLRGEQLRSSPSSHQPAPIAAPAEPTSPSSLQHHELGASPQQPQSQARIPIEKADAVGDALSDKTKFSERSQNVTEAIAGTKSASPRAIAKRKPRERRVPSTSLGRAFGFARLGAGLALGTFQESAKRFWGQQGSLGRDQASLSPFLTEQNAERLALALCRMRGAALKLGQMLSIQDESFLPPQVIAALETVRQGADIMPSRQLHRVISNELGSDWMSRLHTFDEQPMAAASIGQVHRAILKDGMEVAMKIQYPGVASSIDSDIENLKRLLDYTNLIPKGLYLDQAMKVAKEELARECDYVLEAANQKKFQEIFSEEKGVYVPNVIAEFSSTRVLTTEFVAGITIDKVAELNQDVRNSVGTRLLHLTLQELFVHRFMQTDPNWSNFLYAEATDTINLIDFGAARAYSKTFVDHYLEMVFACANQDKENVIEKSRKLGFLTGAESAIMLDAHTEAAFVVGLPFSTPGSFDFHASNLTKRVTKLGVTMLQHRLSPPPDEAYSLHRKLSGAFLACVKLRAVVPCRDLFLDVYKSYKFSDQDGGKCATTSP